MSKALAIGSRAPLACRRRRRHVPHPRGGNMHCHRGFQNAAIGLALCGGMMACSLSQGPEHSWEEFRDRAERVVDGRTIYVVEWDMALTLDELRAYYEANVAHPDIGTKMQDSTVNVVGGHDDVWTSDGGLRLTYCVSNDFGANKSRAVNEMAAATRAWEDVGNVNFRYVPSQDGTCDNTNTSISFP